VSKRRDKVEAAVNSVVYNITTVETAFIPQKALKLVIDVLNYGTETIEINGGSNIFA